MGRLLDETNVTKVYSRACWDNQKDICPKSITRGECNAERRVKTDYQDEDDVKRE